MAIRPVLLIGDPRLRLQAQPVASAAIGGAELATLIVDLRDTMAARHGAGLAAPQIAVPLRVVIFGITVNPRYPEVPPIPETVLINPEVVPQEAGMVLAEEGCMSVPDRREPVRRWARIRYWGLTPEGGVLEREVDGFHARVVQHECDHLGGSVTGSRCRGHNLRRSPDLPCSAPSQPPSSPGCRPRCCCCSPC